MSQDLLIRKKNY